MRYSKWIGAAVVALLAASCFMPWVYVPWLDFTATGLDAGKQFRSPGYFHFIFAFLFLVFSFIPRVWAKQWNLLFTALNLAWAIRNFLKIAACSGGDCPEKKAGIWLMLIASVLLLLLALFPDMRKKIR